MVIIKLQLEFFLSIAVFVLSLLHWDFSIANISGIWKIQWREGTFSVVWRTGNKKKLEWRFAKLYIVEKENLAT